MRCIANHHDLINLQERFYNSIAYNQQVVLSTKFQPTGENHIQSKGADSDQPHTTHGWPIIKTRQTSQRLGISLAITTSIFMLGHRDSILNS